MKIQGEYTVDLQTESGREQVRLVLFEGPEGCRLDLRGSARGYTATAQDYFGALQELRRSLADQGLDIVCNGASVNVYPSAMSRSMGSGIQAFPLTMGRHAKIADLVDIFEHTIEIQPGTVDEQDAFYKRWGESPKEAWTTDSTEAGRGEARHAERESDGVSRYLLLGIVVLVVLWVLLSANC